MRGNRGGNEGDKNTKRRRKGRREITRRRGIRRWK